MRKIWLAISFSAASFGGNCAIAAVTNVPDSALVSSNYYYTDTIGGGLGSVMVTTDGGNAPNIGGSSGRNDDGFSGPIDLGFSLNFFGQTYSQLYINNNGNVSFGGGIAAYTPDGPQGASQPIISPFFADVDTRNPSSGVVHYRSDIPNELIVTWDNVGYYNSYADKTDSFQLVLRGSNYSIPTGEGSIGFFYKTMGWETGGASGGTGGFGGTPGAVGFGDGNLNGEVLQGSISDGISSTVNDTHIWFDQNLRVVPPQPSTVPLPASLWLMASGLFGLEALRRLRRRKS